MAKVINPLLSVEARGRMAGLVYNTWHGISYVKAHSGPNQPNTQAQLAARALMTMITADWRDLTQAQRDAWTVYADAHPESDWTGNPKRLTGQNWFVRCNVQASRAGGAAVTSPPAIAAPDPVTGWVVADAAGDITVNWTTPIVGNEMLDILKLGPLSTGVDPKVEHAVGDCIIVNSSVTPYTVEPSAAAGRWRWWVKVIDPDTGLTSTLVSDLIDMS